MIALGPLAFTAPWVLAALLVLPVLYWLLRVTPPAPKKRLFPAIRLLFGLEAEERTPASAPWWLVLLRLLVAALAILALARPVINPGDALPGSGPVILVVDDGWAAAKDWRARIAALDGAIDRAAREGRPLILATTAPDESGRPPAPSGLIGPGEARGALQALEPKPWPADRQALAAALDGLEVSGSAAILWASDGLDTPGALDLASRLQRLGGLTVLTPSDFALALTAAPGAPDRAGLAVTLNRAAAGPAVAAGLTALADDGRILARATALFEDGGAAAVARFDLPRDLANQLARVTVDGERTAGATVLFDERWRRRPIGIVTDEAQGAGLTLLSEVFYVERALDPIGDLSRADIDTLLRVPQAVIVLPDAAAPGPDDAEALDAWVARGGLLLRFAGPRLAAGETRDGLAPVTLRRGGRVLSGAMLWSEPARLAPFPETGPFHGLALPGDVTVERQVLAEPALDLNEKTWARLADGTPLVTAEPRGDGWVVLVHTTANAEWSNLALSGLFVEMLQRVVRFSQGVAEEGAAERPLPPLESLDGFGRLGAPPEAARPLEPVGEEAAAIAPRRPPGFYGTQAARVALNLGEALAAPRPLGDLPAGVAREGYGDSAERDLSGPLLALALILLLVDGAITLWLRGLKPRLPGRTGSGAVAAIVLAVLATGVPAGPAAAQGGDGFALEALDRTRFAYVVTGDGQVDDISRQGLAGLMEILNARTAIEAGPPIGIDPSRAELAFFPVIYWPLTGREQPLDAGAADRVNRYMANGGVILFDTRDRPMAQGSATDAGRALRRLARGLNIPPLEPVPEDHVLTKAFYLLNEFPGRWAGGAVWVAAIAEAGNDGVSPVIMGGHDWAAAWARDEAGNALYPVVPGTDRQREFAYRFGVNLAMYALTGNYKADQVHVPAILERLGN